MKRNTHLLAGFVISILAAGICSCHSASKQSDYISSDSLIKKVAYIDDEKYALEGKWHLQPQLASDTVAGRIPELTFIATGNRFSGSTGCNRMTGRYTRKGDSLQFNSNIAMTRMACIGYNEQPFVDNLLRTNHFVIKDGVLMLMYNETILSRWVRHLEDQPIKRA